MIHNFLKSLNSVNTKKQIYLSKFDEFCKLQNHKEDLENSVFYFLYKILIYFFFAIGSV